MQSLKQYSFAKEGCRDSFILHACFVHRIYMPFVFLPLSFLSFMCILHFLNSASMTNLKALRDMDF